MAFLDTRRAAVLALLAGFLFTSGCGSREEKAAPRSESFLSTTPPAAIDWSLDDADLVFVSTRDGDADIYSMAGGDTSWVNLTDSDSQDHWPEFSPDGSKIAFYSDRTGRRDIYVMNADGSDPVRLTNDEDTENLPSWTPDGRILFTSYRMEPSDTARAQHVYVMDADGSGMQRLDLAGGREAQGAVMGPDGSIVYGTPAPGGNFDLWLTAGDDMVGSRFTDGSAVYAAPAFSPDGRWIAFHAYHRDARSDVLVLDVESGAIDTASTGGSHFYPRWSPDARWLVTCSEVSHGNYDVTVFPIDGSAAPRAIASGPGRECEARWRPVIAPPPPAS